TPPEHSQRARDVPAPANVPHRRVEQRLAQKLSHCLGIQIVKDVFQGKTVGWTKRQNDRVFGRRSLQLEIESAAETLAQRESPGAIQSTAKWRVQNELHAAAVVKKSF